MLRERNQKHKVTFYVTPLMGNIQDSNLLETESISVVPIVGEMGMEGIVAGCGRSSGIDGNVWAPRMVMMAQ